MTEKRRPRRDAVANRERILTAAREAFRADGLSVDMRGVATLAGVGIGTLYRHFPTRGDLLLEVTGADLSALADTHLPDRGSARESLRAFFRSTLRYLISNRAAIDLLTRAAPTDRDLQRCLSHLRSIGLDAVERSAVDHTLATDVTADDIAHQLLGLIRIAQLIPEDTPNAIDHHVKLAVRGLSAEADTRTP
ncbi:TetR/AcrR family transcriptional regulator [Microbacterium saperdae]